MQRALFASVLLVAFGTPLLPAADTAQRLVLTSAASVQGLAPFYSDVRVFNTSYTDPVTVRATYRCYIPTCPGSAVPVDLVLSPRESRALDDIVANTFGAVNSAGGVEFDWVGDSEQVVVTSRLYSTAPVPTVGMFIPGLSLSEAFPDTVLTSVKNGGSALGFRTNAGVFNPGDAAVSVSMDVYDGSVVLGNPVTATVPGHSGVQINQIFRAAGVETHATGNGVIAVHASGPVFSFAAVIDNATTDPYLVQGAEDGPKQAFTPALTPTPTPSPSSTHTVNVGQGGNRFADVTSGTATTTINVGDTVEWVWSGSTNHGTDNGACSSGGGYYGEPTCTSTGSWLSGVHAAPFSWSHTFTEAGTFNYFCDVHQGSMTGKVIVNPAPAALRAVDAPR